MQECNKGEEIKSFMLSEKDFENIICRYPELIEEHLILKGRQVTLFGRRMDLLFGDSFKRKLIIELKIGPIKDEHIGQILSYEGMLLSAEEPNIRIMLVGNRVPPNIQRSLDHHGIAWKEITLSRIKELLKEKNDKEFLGLFNGEYKPVNLEEKKKVYSSSLMAKKESSGVWIFQSNPKWYKLMDKLRFGSNRETWRVMRFKDEIKKGNTVLFWISGEAAGIYALGIVDSDPAPILADNGEKDTSQFSTPEYEQAFPISKHICTRVWVKYTKKFLDSPILKKDLMNNSILKDLSIIKQPQGTNFRVSKEQASELKKLISF